MKFLHVASLLAIAASGLIAVPQAAAAPGPVWGPCPADAKISASANAQCTTVEVPMDYAKADGQKIKLTVSMIRATGQRKSTIFVNPGGPGSGSLGMWAAMREDLPPKLREGYDLVAVQPRGLQWSTPMACGPDAAKGKDVDRATCEKEQPGYARTITTENTARDFNEVRKALGLERIEYLGYSYGTYLGAVYASLFPQHTGRFVLDSNVNPDWVWNEMVAQQQVNRQQRISDLFDWIAANDSIYGLGNTRQQVAGVWADQVRREGGTIEANLAPGIGGREALASLDLGLDAKSMPNGLAARIANVLVFIKGRDSKSTSRTFVNTSKATYSRNSWPSFAAYLATARNKPPASPPRAPGVLPPALVAEDLLFQAIPCNENASRTDSNAKNKALLRMIAGGSFADFAAGAARSGERCEGWPPTTSPVQITDRGLRAKPLVIQSDHDGATPAAGGPATAQKLNGHLIKVDGGDHGVFANGNTVLDNAVVEYFDTGKTSINHAKETPIQAPNPPKGFKR